MKNIMFNRIVVCMGLLVFSVPLVYAGPVLQVKPESVDFGEVEPYSTKEAQKKITIANCGDDVLCWGLTSNDSWLTVEDGSGMIDLTVGDRYFEATVSACGLCVGEIGVYEGSFTAFQYNYNGIECTTAKIEGSEIDIVATMTISEFNTMDVDPDILNFGSVLDELSFDIRNTGAGEMEWEAQVSEEADWLTIEGGTSTSGMITTGGSDTVTLEVDRSKVSGCVDVHSTTVKVTSANATPNEAIVSVNMQKVIEPPFPSSPTPTDGSTDHSLYTTLKWQEGASQEDVGGIVYFDVYFSTNQDLVESDSPSVLVCSDLEIPYCDPSNGGGQLQPDTTYYWKVKAVDECENNTVNGDVWSFTTGLMMGNACLVSTVLQLDDAENRVLREFRDGVLASNPKTERYVNLYYSPQAIEALLILLSNPELRMCMNEMVKEWIPAIQSGLRGEKGSIDSLAVEDMVLLLEELKKEASPLLKRTINAMQKDLATGDLFQALGFSVKE